MAQRHLHLPVKIKFRQFFPIILIINVSLSAHKFVVIEIFLLGTQFLLAILV